MDTATRKKDRIINIRVSQSRKDEIKENAAKLGMTISSYIEYLETHQRVVELPYGKELMKEIYALNNQLNDLTQCPIIEVQPVRDAISQAVKKINAQVVQMEAGK